MAQKTQTPTPPVGERSSYTTKKDRYLERKKHKESFKSGNMASIPLHIQQQLGLAMQPNLRIGGARPLRQQKEFNAAKDIAPLTPEKFIKLCRECKKKNAPMPLVFPDYLYLHLKDLMDLWDEISLPIKNTTWDHIANVVKASTVPVYFVTGSGKVHQFDNENPIKTIFHNPIS